MAPIHFDGGEVSKANSSSQLAIQAPRSANGHQPCPPCPQLLNRVVQSIRESMGLGLFGVDVIVEEATARLVRRKHFQIYEFNNKTEIRRS